MRTLTDAFKTAIAASGGTVNVGLLCEINYPDTPVLAWTGHGNITWDAKTWAGIGDLGDVTTIDHKPGPVAGHTKLTLNGVNSALVTLGLLETSQLSRVSLWLAAMTETTGTWAVIDDPLQIFRGIVDTHRIIEGDDYDTIEVNVETFLARLTRQRIVRLTHAEQTRRFPGDLGEIYAGRISEGSLDWGMPIPAVGGRTTNPTRNPLGAPS